MDRLNRSRFRRQKLDSLGWLGLVCVLAGCTPTPAESPTQAPPSSTSSGISTEPIDPASPPALLVGQPMPGEPKVSLAGVVGVASGCVVLQLEDGRVVLPLWPYYFHWSPEGTIATIYGEVRIGQRLTETDGNLLDWDDYRAALPTTNEQDAAAERCGADTMLVAPMGTVEQIAGPE